MCDGKCAWLGAHLEVRGQLVGSSLRPVGFGDRTRVIRLGGKHLYLLSDLACSEMSLVETVIKAVTCCVDKSAAIHLVCPSPTHCWW